MKKIIIGLGALLIVVVAAVSIAALSGNKTSNDQMGGMPGSAMTSPNSRATTISIKQYMFSPMSTTVKVGTKVTWTNEDAVAHTVTADQKQPGAPDSMNIAQHGSYSFTFTKAGTFKYHCLPHPYMHGTVIVTE